MKITSPILSLLVLFCTSATAVPQNAAPMTQRIARLEAVIQGVEAIRAIKRLQYAYGHYAEFGLWNDLADLFADKGIGHYPSGNLGKEAIRKLFLEDIGKGKLGLGEGKLYPHIMLEPVVTLDQDGKTAKGRWRVLAMLGSYGGTAVWAGGIYENEYILENGVWKINDLHYYSRYTGSYGQAGWTADKEAIPIHYDPAGAGAPVRENPNLPVAADASPSLEMLSKRLADLTLRAQRLNDEDGVENLQHIYGYYVDRKMWDDVADLFAGDATMELGLQGVYVGKSSIRRALNQFGPPGLREGELNDHLQLQTIVHIAPDGRTAKARGVELAMSGLNGAGGQWSEGIFENEFIKQSGIWKIKALHYYPRLLTDYDKGWAKDAQPAPGPSKDFPPDRPPTVAYAIFPKFYIPQFHFANPVTSRATQYPGGIGQVPAGTPSSRRRQGAGETPALPARSPQGGKLPLTEFSQRVAETERLLNMATAYDAAENIASAYGYYLDEFMWDETADLFAVDGTRNLSSIGFDAGREGIRQSLKRRYPAQKSMDYLLAHQLVQPVIHVAHDGQSTKMRVRLFQLGGPSGGNGFWIAGVYECTTGLENHVWKFKSMDLNYIWTADYKKGWAHIDKDSKGVIATPFPKIINLSFHYNNPVTGRKPPGRH